MTELERWQNELVPGNPQTKEMSSGSRLEKEWLEYFVTVEEMENEKNTAESKLQGCITDERYGDAASIQERIRILQSKDTVRFIQSEMKLAVDEERFADAAKLRDEGMGHLLGWWAARHPNDPKGVLVHVRPGYCRFSGRLFTPSDLGTLCGVWDPSIELVMETESEEQELGHPFMEVFLKQDNEGRLQNQACSITMATTSVDINEDDQIDDSDSDLMLQLRQLAEHLFDQGMDDGESSLHEDADAEVVAAIIVSDDEPSLIESDVKDDEEDVPSDNEKDEDEEYEMPESERHPASIRWWDQNRFVLSTESDILNNDNDDDSDSDTEEDASDVIGHSQGKDVIVKISLNRIQPKYQEMLRKWIDGQKKSSIEAKLHIAEATLQLSNEDDVDVDVPSSHPLKNLNKNEDKASDCFDHETMFTRLPLETGSSDRFVGYFMGHFGSHGLELLHLTRRLDPKAQVEFLEAQKITGDKTVPAGEISFRVALHRKNRSAPDPVLEELGVRATYKGKGKTAHEGFTHEQWVDGDLLVFDSHSPLSNGAELGFVWHVPMGRRGRRHALQRVHVLLHRVTLPEFKEKE